MRSASSSTSSCSPTDGRTASRTSPTARPPRRSTTCSCGSPATKTAGSARSAAATRSPTAPPTSKVIVHANVGPPIVVICEELNTTQRVLDRYYKKELRQRGDPARSPASDALDIGLFIGRQVKVFYYLICQRGSVKAVSGAGGGGDARDNIGVWAMCDPSPATFRMIGWDHDVPPAAGHVGRKQIVTAQWVKESQNLYMTGAEARRLAISGTRAIPRSDMPYMGDVQMSCPMMSPP